MPTSRTLPALLAAACLCACTTLPPAPASAPAPVNAPASASASTPTIRTGAAAATPPKAEAVTVTDGGSGILLRMRRSGCYGRCPSYTVEIDDTGRVRFEGERFTAATGVQHGQARPAALEALHRLLREPAVAALSGAYTPGDPKRCGVWATDFASVAIELRIDGRSRRIEHYLGCQSAPAALVQLEQAIDTAGGTEQWIEGGATE